MRAVAEVEARILGASTVVCAAWRILSTPRCERRWRSSAACELCRSAAGRRATWVGGGADAMEPKSPIGMTEAGQAKLMELTEQMELTEDFSQ